MRVDKTMRIPPDHLTIQELEESYDAGDMRATMPAWIAGPDRVWREIDAWLGAFFGVTEL